MDQKTSLPPVPPIPKVMPNHSNFVLPPVPNVKTTVTPKNITIPGPPPIVPIQGDKPMILKSNKITTVQKKDKLKLKDFRGKKPLADIDKPRDWTLLKGYAQSESGSAGVFFCLTEEDEVVVIKGSSNVGEEIFASDFAHFLGVYAPKMRLIEYAPQDRQFKRNREWKDIKNRLLALSDEGSHKAEKELNRAFFIVMQYIPNTVDLNGIESNHLNKKTLMDIGRMVVMDVVINNWDRLPNGILFDHEGNPANLLFNLDEIRCCAIDNSTTEIHKEMHPEQYNKYMEKVRMFGAAVKKRNGDPVDAICKAIKFHSNIDVPEDDKQWIWDGMTEVVERLRNVSPLDVENVKTRVDKMLTGSDWDDVWKTMLDLISVDFISTAIAELKHGYDE